MIVATCPIPLIGLHDLRPTFIEDIGYFQFKGVNVEFVFTSSHRNRKGSAFERAEVLAVCPTGRLIYVMQKFSAFMDEYRLTSYRDHDAIAAASEECMETSAS